MKTMLKNGAAFVIATFAASTAFAQERPGAAVSTRVAAMNVSSRTDLSVGAAFTYKFNEVVGLEIETTLVPDIAGGDDDDFVIRGAYSSWSSLSPELEAIGLIYPPPTIGNRE